MDYKLEKSEARDLVETAGWEDMLPENSEVNEGSPTDYDFSASARPDVTVGSKGVQKAFRVEVRSGQRTYIETFTSETDAGQYLEGVVS